MAAIKLNKIYPISKEVIWEYLTNDDMLSSWCMPTKGFLVEKGNGFTFQTIPSKFFDGIFLNTVIDFGKNSFLVYQCMNKNLKLDTVVTWKLAEENGKTELSLEHSGFKFKDVFTKIALTGGWKKMLNNDLYKIITGT